MIFLPCFASNSSEISPFPWIFFRQCAGKLVGVFENFFGGQISIVVKNSDGGRSHRASGADCGGDSCFGRLVVRHILKGADEFKIRFDFGFWLWEGRVAPAT